MNNFVIGIHYLISLFQKHITQIKEGKVKRLQTRLYLGGCFILGKFKYRAFSKGK